MNLPQSAAPSSISSDLSRQAPDKPPTLVELLASGGDSRLHVNAATGLNQYGCRPAPQPRALSFSSSTASTISERAFAAAKKALSRLQSDDQADAFDSLIEATRTDLKGLWQLPAQTDIIFAPSGTDAELRALFLVQCVLRSPIVSIVVGADETGSGIPLASSGRHFDSETANGKRVIKGRRIRGLANDAGSILIPTFTAGGRIRPLGDIDEDVLRSAQDAIVQGNGVALHVITHSKLGTHAPSAACVQRIRELWGERIQVIVDACQARLSRAQIKFHLAQDSLVLVTGSKFFTGPAFSGALLVPAGLSARVAAPARAPDGLADYSNASDWPAHYQALRASLPAGKNLGQTLRWVAAIEEMRAYFDVPGHFRTLAVAEFSKFSTARITADPSLKLLMPPVCDIEDAEEFSARTVFPFLIERNGRACSLAETTAIYHAANEDLSTVVRSGTRARQQLLATRCHVGQPVAIPQTAAEPAGVIRISSDARMISDSWLGGTEAGALQRFRAKLESLELVFDKLRFLLDHYESIAHGRAA